MSKRRFSRPNVGTKNYRCIFIISTEGEKTEPEYFEMFNIKEAYIKIECLRKKGKSSPKQVLKRMKKRLSEANFRKRDQAWLVVDKDKWTNDQLEELCNWSKKKGNYGFALSNPKFEFWLLLHFEDGKKVKSSKDCTERLNKYIPDYDKCLNKVKKDLLRDIDKAVERAKTKDNPPCEKWPQGNGSTVYRLIEEIQNKPQPKQA